MARVGVGVAFVLGGLVGFLPILGFWMVPVGLLVLSVDMPPVRRFNRRATVWFLRKWAAFRGRAQSGSA